MPSRSSRNRSNSARSRRIAEQQAVLQQLQSGGGITAYPASPILGAARTLLGKGPMGTVYGAELDGKSVLKMPGGMSQTGFLGPINVAGRTWYPAKKGEDVIFMQSDGTGGFGRAAKAKQDTRIGGLFSPNKIELGLDAQGNVDLTQGDEYKTQMAQYRDLIAKEKQKEAEDLGMKIWMQKYGKSGLGLTGPNPLMQDMTNAPSGFGTFTPTQGPTPAVLQASDAPMKAFGQEVKTFFPGAGPEAFNPLDAQEQQQAATAAQADNATTAGMKIPIRNRVQAFLYGGM